MAIQANLNVSDALKEKFGAAQKPDGPRTLSVRIKAEKLVYVSEKPNTGDELNDFASLAGDISETDPVFFLFNRAAGTDNTKSWALVAYVPEMASVRQRMLYASSRDDLKTKLGTAFFCGEYYCNDKADMTFSNFKYALDGSSPSDLASVMTEKELLLKEEGETATVASSGNGMSVVPFKFKPDLDEAMKAFAMGERKAVEISVHAKTEVCQLGALAGDSTLDQLTANFPKKPRFFCLNYGRKVFVFFCPDDAKVRTKMLLATCKSAVTGQAISKHGIEFDKQVEIRGADELAAAFAEEAAPSDEAAKTNFTKAKRKTRGKRRLNTKKKFAWT